MKNNRKVDVVVDLQFGSTGKGLLCDFLAVAGKYDTVVNANLPNAGHTTVTPEGRVWMHKAMPNAVMVSKRIMMGPGSAFSPARLAEELKGVADLIEGKIFVIHEACMIVTQEMKDKEQQTLSRISSTMQGSGEAVVSKIRREVGAIARDQMPLLAEYGLDKYVVSHADYLQHLLDSESILVEGAQGYSLGHNSGFYPYCTSRDCTVTRYMADCAIPAGWLRKAIGVARLHPIRVGNTADGFSGDIYPDQEELTWEQLGVAPELTTVTKRVRRVFSFSYAQIHEAIIANGIDEVMLNFVNYNPHQAVDVIEQVNEMMGDLGYIDKDIITMVGTGPRRDQVISVQEFLDRYEERGYGAEDCE